MSLHFEPLHPLFAAEASGLDLTRPVDAATVRALDDVHVDIPAASSPR